MTKRMIIMLVSVAVVFGLIFGFQWFRGMMMAKFFASMGNQPQTIATVTAGKQDWQPALQAVGSLRAINGADLALDVAGIVDQINFNSGDEVKAGAVLLRLRPEDDAAKLTALQATAQLAQITYNRDAQQLKAQAISQAVFDADEANLKSAQAQVEQQRAMLEKKVLRAPFDGRIGIRAVDLGQYLNSGTMIVTLQQLDPIYVDFNLPEQNLAQVKLGQKITAKMDAYPGQPFTGKVIAIDPKVDAASRNVQLRARIENPEHLLVPGMYAKIEVDQGEPVKYVTLPATAITFNPYGATAFLVDSKGKDDKGEPVLEARQTFVTTGPSRGDQVAVLKGISEGDQVVAAGQLKLRNGTKVVVNNKVLPTAEAHPNTPDN